MAKRQRNIWILVLFLFAGIVIGGLIGELAGQIDFLWWLGYGKEFGLIEPITADLQVVVLTFGIQFKINIASIVGVAIAIFIYSKT